MGRSRFTYAALLFLSVATGCLGGLRLSGAVPASVDSVSLGRAYARIWISLAPELPLDTTTVEVVYYRRSDKRPLGSRLPEWGGGGAIGRDSVVVPVDRAPILDMDLQRITVHELVHIVLVRAYGRTRIPRWFHEGLAMALSGELSFDEHVIVSRAIFAKRLLPLDTIERVNLFNSYGAQLAYAQSHLAVLFLIEHYGLDGIPEILDTARKLRSFEGALKEILGLSSGEIEQMTTSSISARYRYVFLAADTYLYGIGLLALAAIAFAVTRIRNQRRMAQIEREEQLEQSAECDIDTEQNSRTAQSNTESLDSSG